MAFFIETKHTLSTIEKIRRELIKTFTVFSIISMLAFLVYYVYLVIINAHQFLYITIYSVLIFCILSFFIIEIFLNENKGILRIDKRIITEKKRKIKVFIKILKYLAKTALIVVAICETKINTNLQLSNLINIFSIILLFIQIIFDIIVNYTIKQLDYFRLSISLDYEESLIIRKFADLFNTTQSLQNKATKLQDKDKYTEEEKEIVKKIEKNDKIFQENKDKERQELKDIIKINKKKNKIKIPNIFKIKKKK